MRGRWWHDLTKSNILFTSSFQNEYTNPVVFYLNSGTGFFIIKNQLNETIKYKNMNWVRSIVRMSDIQNIYTKYKSLDSVKYTNFMYCQPGWSILFQSIPEIYCERKVWNNMSAKIMIHLEQRFLFSYYIQ